MKSNILKKVYVERFSSLSSKAQNNFHLKSIRNFIEHFENLSYDAQGIICQF